MRACPSKRGVSPGRDSGRLRGRAPKPRRLPAVRLIQSEGLLTLLTYKARPRYQNEKGRPSKRVGLFIFGNGKMFEPARKQVQPRRPDA